MSTLGVNGTSERRFPSARLQRINEIITATIAGRTNFIRTKGVSSWLHFGRQPEWPQQRQLGASEFEPGPNTSSRYWCRACYSHFSFPQQACRHICVWRDAPQKWSVGSESLKKKKLIIRIAVMLTTNLAELLASKKCGFTTHWQFFHSVIFLNRVLPSWVAI